MITVIHGGQTGVDRGAHDGAIANGWEIAGYMPRNCCDELGPIPDAVARHLRESAGGYAERTEANVRVSDALLVVVPDARVPMSTPGTAWTITYARDRRLPVKVVDPHGAIAEVAAWISAAWRVVATSRAQVTLFASEASRSSGLRLMIAGPRARRWSSGRGETSRLLRDLAVSLG